MTLACTALTYLWDASEGTVSVCEQRRDNVRDGGEPIVVAQSGDPPTSDRDTVQAALRELGITNVPYGLKISDLQNYVRTIRSALRSAENGDVSSLELSLPSVRRQARDLRLGTDATFLAGLVVAAYTTAYESFLNRAATEAINGDPEKAMQFTTAALLFAAAAPIDAVDDARIADILFPILVTTAASTL